MIREEGSEGRQARVVESMVHVLTPDILPEGRGRIIEVGDALIELDRGADGRARDGREGVMALAMAMAMARKMMHRADGGGGEGTGLQHCHVDLSSHQDLQQHSTWSQERMPHLARGLMPCH